MSAQFRYCREPSTKHTVDLHLAVADDLLDLALLLQVGKAPPGEGAVDLESVDEGGDSHEAVGLDILIELVGSGLVEDDGVLGLVLDCCFCQRLAICVCVCDRAYRHRPNLNCRGIRASNFRHE